MLVTDHQPSVFILNPEKGLPAVTAARLQRYAISLSEYIKYRSTTQHSSRCAFAFSEPQTVNAAEAEGRTYCINQLETLPVTIAELRQATARDLVSAKVLQVTQVGWSPTVSEEMMKPYFERRQIHSGARLCDVRNTSGDTCITITARKSTG